MLKRRPYAQDGEGSRKRPRVVHEAPTSEEVHSARQLMQLLAFNQDLQKARHGIQSFKLLLDKVNDPDKQTPEAVALLRSYLESVRPRIEDAAGEDNDGDTEPVYLPDVMDTWDFAARMNSDNLMSAVPVVLALLIKYMSHVLDLAPICLGLCRTLLRHRQLELIARNVSAEKGKEFVISPTLRLLREIITFDGGAVAKPLFRARNFTYRSLARNMGIRFLGDGIEDVNRTSVRTNAVRFFLSSLTFLHPEAKAELLAQREIVGALTRTVKDDPPYLVHDILTTIQNHVVKDKKLPKSAKAKLFNAGTLIRLSSLYSYVHDGGAEETPAGIADERSSSSRTTTVSDAAHTFLLNVCTSPTAGVLREQTGCYPQGVEPNASVSDGPTAAEEGTLSNVAGAEDDSLAIIGLDRIVWMDKFTDDIPVYNHVLADFISNLRPWSSTRQSELVLSIFKGAPELLAWYFINKKAFTFEPKISATWVGFAAFLFNTIKIDLPLHFGIRRNYARVPPPTSVLVDNILPLPLTQKILSRCLAHKSKLVPFFTVRLLALSMEKLQYALRMHDAAARRHPIEAMWSESIQRVVDQFCRRCPPMKDVINAYRAAEADDLLYREATSRVLRLYYEVVPQVALLSKFDVSPHLFAGIRQVDEHLGSPQDKTLKLMELENLLAIAGYSPGMQWFSKAKGLGTSPFTALLKVSTEANVGVAVDAIRDVLGFVAQEQQLVVPSAKSTTNRNTTALTALVHSLKAAAGSTRQSLLSDPVWAFVDNCIVRCANGPVKYIEMIEELATEAAGSDTAGGDTVSIDPLTMAMAEQLHFATQNAGTKDVQRLAGFLQQYLSCCQGSQTAMAAIVDKVSAAFPSGSDISAKLSVGLSNRWNLQPQRQSGRKTSDPTSLAVAATPKRVNVQKGQPVVDGEQTDPEVEDTLEELLGLSSVRALDTTVLSRWPMKPADDLVEEGHAASLIMLLVSGEDSTRRQALVNLANMAAKIRHSTYDEKDQIWLLLTELVESTKAWMTDSDTEHEPVPSHFAAFACHALDVLRNPLHCLYAKVNAFLMVGPVWRMQAAFPLVHDIVHGGPSEDDSYYAELHWLLAYLLDSLRTLADVDRFRTRRLFETIFSVASNPYMRSPLRRQALRLLCRATAIDGGSTTLITRSGAVSWLEAYQGAPVGSDAMRVVDAGEQGRHERGQDGPEADETRLVRMLLQRLWETCDQTRVNAWSMGGVAEAVDSMVA